MLNQQPLHDPAKFSTTSDFNTTQLLAMLILETHKDVATKADGKDGSMSKEP